MSALQSVSDQIENIPGFGIVSDVYESMAPDYLKTKDPFYVKTDDDQQVRRRVPEGASEIQRKKWKQVIKQAWNYDRNFCCGCIGFDIGLGIIPIINILPVIGPILAYTLQGSLIRSCAGGGAPLSLQSKMAANCATDFVISICPILGVICSWLFGCATRNAALYDSWLRESIAKGKKAPGPHGQGVPRQLIKQKKPNASGGPVYVHDDRGNEGAPRDRRVPQSTQKPQSSRGPNGATPEAINRRPVPAQHSQYPQHSQDSSRYDADQNTGYPPPQRAAPRAPPANRPAPMDL